MDDVKLIVTATLREMGAKFDELSDDAQLEDDLGLESLMRVELATKLQKKLKKPLVSEIDQMLTIGDVLNYLRSEPRQ
jgi:acyl carrier protein